MNPPLPSNNPSDNQNIINQIDDFIAGLVPPASATSETEAPDEPEVTYKVETPKTDAEMRDFVLKHSAELVENSVKSIIELQKIAVATGDADMVAGLASLITASTNAIESVSKIHVLNQKLEAAKEVKRIEIEGKKEIQKLKNDGYLNLPNGQTNILVATREEIMQQLTGKAKQKAADQVVEIEATNTSTVTLSSAP